MPFSRPSLDGLAEQAVGDIETGLAGSDARTSEGVLSVFAATWAMAGHALYGYLDWIALQVLVDSAEDEMLDRHGGIWGVTRQPGTYAAGTVELSGEPGAPVATDAVLRRADGAEYIPDAAVTIGSGGTASAAVTAAVPGAAGNTAAGISLTFLSPVLGVALTATVDEDGLADGIDGEDDDSYRARILDRIQQPAHGGNAHDYVAWARAVSGVSRAWCDPLALGPGTVVVRFMMDERYVDGIPREEDVAAVAAHIAPLRPATADVRVHAPAPRPLNLTISGLQPDDAATRSAIAAELADLVLRESAPGATLRISHIREAISTAAGEVDHTLVAPVANVTHAAGEIAVMGTIVWLP